MGYGGGVGGCRAMGGEEVEGGGGGQLVCTSSSVRNQTWKAGHFQRSTITRRSAHTLLGQGFCGNPWTGFLFGIRGDVPELHEIEAKVQSCHYPDLR